MEYTRPMARLSPEDAAYYEQLELPSFATAPFVSDGKPLSGSPVLPDWWATSSGIGSAIQPPEPSSQPIPERVGE